MSKRYFPLCMNLEGNNCGIIGGGEVAARCAQGLIDFGARVTVVSPTMCPALKQLEQEGHIRHIPRKYFRGDCNHMLLCIAATDDRNVNIAVASECKAKNLPVYVTEPVEYGTFRFPTMLYHGDVTVTLIGETEEAVQQDVEAIAALFNTAEPRRP